MPQEKSPRNLLLLTGSTGYIGGRLVPRLLAQGYRLRCLVRNPDLLRGTPWRAEVEIVAGDVLQPDSLARAMEGVKAAYYLVHSLGSGPDFHQRDLSGANYFGNAASAAGIEQIIYLGGLAAPSADLSEHLRSRQQTGDTLRCAGVPVTEFRAGVIVGSGSVSFEMIRYLAERVPVMICPRWVYTRTQPIGIGEVLDYLTSAPSVTQSRGKILEIGGAEILTYGEMMTIYAEVRGLKRRMISVPVLTPRLSSYWVDLVTPVPAAIARPLIEGLRNESIVRDPLARRLFPKIQLASYRTAVERALAELRADNPHTALIDGGSAGRSDVTPVVLKNRHGMIIEHRQRLVAAPPSDVYRVFSGLGGHRGWLCMDWAWRLRGSIDRLVGGVGLRRFRRDPNELRVGDTLDFWRVEAVESDHMLRLRAEMKVPGKAWLQFQVKPAKNQNALLSQTAFFAPKGLLGLLYWLMLYPLHKLIFRGLVDQIARRAMEQTRS